LERDNCEPIFRGHALGSAISAVIVLHLSTMDKNDFDESMVVATSLQQFYESRNAYLNLQPSKSLWHASVEIQWPTVVTIERPSSCKLLLLSAHEQPIGVCGTCSRFSGLPYRYNQYLLLICRYRVRFLMLSITR
jgi:hypothetical protein